MKKRGGKKFREAAFFFRGPPKRALFSQAFKKKGGGGGGGRGGPPVFRKAKGGLILRGGPGTGERNFVFLGLYGQPQKSVFCFTGVLPKRDPTRLFCFPGGGANPPNLKVSVKRVFLVGICSHIYRCFAWPGPQKTRKGAAPPCNLKSHGNFFLFSRKKR